MTAPTYPTGLPLGLQADRSYRLHDPILRTTMASGRARQRRMFSSVPEFAQVSWSLSGPECTLLETWLRDIAGWAGWFVLPLRTPGGLASRTVRLTGMYSGPEQTGPNRWKIRAELELSAQAALPVGWAQYPDAVLNMGLLDQALTVEWPAG